MRIVIHAESRGQNALLNSRGVREGSRYRSVLSVQPQKAGEQIPARFDGFLGFLGVENYAIIFQRGRDRSIVGWEGSVRDRREELRK